MNRHLLLASVALFSLAVATPSFADNLNPQPEPPGRSKILHSQWQHTTNTIGSATGGAGSGKAMMRKAGGTQTNAAAIHGFNPQPDPPGKPLSQIQSQH